MKRVTWSDVERLGMQDSTVAACIRAQRMPQSGITREQALMAMVSYLVGDKQTLQAAAVQAAATQAPGVSR